MSLKQAQAQDMHSFMAENDLEGGGEAKVLEEKRITGK